MCALPVSANAREFERLRPGASKESAPALRISRRRSMKRTAPTAKGSHSESIIIYLSGPASGNQVTSISRTILDYTDKSDQPRISDVMAQVRAKQKSEPQKSGGENYTIDPVR